MSFNARAMVGQGYEFPERREEVHGPWLGVRDGPAPTQGDPSHAQAFTNSYVPDPVPSNPERSGPVVARPGFEVITTPSAPLGTPTNRYPQGFAFYDPPGGVAPTFGPVLYAFAGGRMYQIGNALGLGGASIVDVTPATIAISTTVPFVHAVNFAGKLIVTDGSHPPWIWDGTTATYIDWDLSGVQAHSVAYGPPTVYYDQLFFVMESGSGPTGNGSRTTLIWSEVNNPALGYVQTVAGFTYADNWILSQTGADDIQCILGTNAALYYWRKSSLGAIYGQVGTNFTTTGTHDAISQTIGTICPKCVIVTDREIYFLDQTGKPYVMEYGGFLVPMWQDSVTTFGAASAGMYFLGHTPNQTNIPPYSATGCYDPNTKCVYWSIATPVFNNLPAPTIYPFDTRTKKYLGAWAHTSQVMPPIAMMQVSAVANPTTGGFVPGATIVLHQDLDGNFYLLGGVGGLLPAGLGIDKSVKVASGGTNLYAIENSVWASEMLYDQWAESVYDRVEWVTLPFNFCNVNIDYKVPSSTSFAPALNVSQPVSATSLRSELTVGLNATGRTILPRISNTPVSSLVGGQRVNINALGIVQVKVRGYRVDMNPSVP